MTFSVYHDPGHGPSAGTSHGELIERDWVLLMAEDLIAAYPHVPHGLLRTGEQGTSYTERAECAKRNGASVVFCHHVNANSEPSMSGLMVHYIDGDNTGRDIAEAIANAAPVGLRRRTATIASRPGDWTERAYNVMNTYASRGVPVILIEWGFATNEKDREILLSARRRPELCAAGIAGIARARALL